MRRILTYGGYFEAFISTLSEAVVKKIDYGLVLLKTQERVPTKFVKHIEDGRYELRTEWEGNIYRVFFIFDGGNGCAVQRLPEENPEDTAKRD